jgi:hypothetical protein
LAVCRQLGYSRLLTQFNNTARTFYNPALGAGGYVNGVQNAAQKMWASDVTCTGTPKRFDACKMYGDNAALTPDSDTVATMTSLTQYFDVRGKLATDKYTRFRGGNPTPYTASNIPAGQCGAATTCEHGVGCTHDFDAGVDCDPTSVMEWADHFGYQDNYNDPYNSTGIREKFGADIPPGTDPCRIPSLSIECPQTCLAKQGFYTRPDGKQIGTLYCFLTHMQMEFAKALGDYVIDGTGVVNTTQGKNAGGNSVDMYDFKSLSTMSDKTLTKWAASNVVEIEFKAADTSMSGGPVGYSNGRVDKHELLYYFASICNPENITGNFSVKGAQAGSLVPKFDELFAEFDNDDNLELDFNEFFDMYEFAMDMSIQAYGPVEFLLYWFVHPVLTQMGGDLHGFELSDWKGEMCGSQVN